MLLDSMKLLVDLGDTDAGVLYVALDVRCDLLLLKTVVRSAPHLLASAMALIKVAY
jgi:hypothetical protein